MFLLLSILSVCITVIFVVNSLQKHPITFVIHKKLEEIRPEPQELSEEDKKALDDQADVIDGMNEIIKFTQEFLGGESDAEPKRKAE